jgi:hypothetical protein
MEEFIYFFPINSNPLGTSYADWTIKWWQWLTSIPKDINPAYDETGQYLHVNQTNAYVTFLCQVFDGAKSIPTRRSSVIKKRFFFLPIMTWISIEGIDGENDEKLMNIARAKMDKINKLELLINGIDFSKDLNKNRVITDFFCINLPENNIFDMPHGTKKCVSDGYWIFFEVNSEKLICNTDSLCSSGKNRIAVNYELSLE